MSADPRADWSATDLAAALARLGITTRQIHQTIDGQRRNGRGLDRAVAPALRAAPIASLTRLAAARAEQALPPRSRVAAATGAAIGVDTVATSGL